MKEALAQYFTNYFHPAESVTADNIVPTAGSGNALDALIFTLCDTGDAVLCPAPAWCLLLLSPPLFFWLISYQYRGILSVRPVPCRSSHRPSFCQALVLTVLGNGESLICHHPGNGSSIQRRSRPQTHQGRTCLKPK